MTEFENILLSAFQGSWFTAEQACKATRLSDSDAMNHLSAMIDSKMLECKAINVPVQSSADVIFYLKSK